MIAPFYAEKFYYDHATCDACDVRNDGVNQRNATGGWLCYDCAELAEVAAEVAEAAAPESADVEESPVCPARYALVMGAATAGAMVEALKIHNVECVVCGSGKRIVQIDRELLDADAVCCLGEVA